MIRIEKVTVLTDPEHLGAPGIRLYLESATSSEVVFRFVSDSVLSNGLVLRVEGTMSTSGDISSAVDAIRAKIREISTYLRHVASEYLRLGLDGLGMEVPQRMAVI